MLCYAAVILRIYLPNISISHVKDLMGYADPEYYTCARSNGPQYGVVELETTHDRGLQVVFPELQEPALSY